MALISFSNVSKYYGSDLILDHISFTINAKEKVALIGSNGAGKTTIFRLILKEEEPTLVEKEDKVGEINILGNLRIGYLDQNAIKNPSFKVIDELKEAFKETLKIEKDLNECLKMINDSPNNQDLIGKYNDLLRKFENNHGYTYLQEIDEMLNRFGFDESYKDRVINSLSGGERMKIAFIKILLFHYDVLLLDEPTNHLDISTIEWLENYLKSYNGTIFFISHDRYFLEGLSTKIIELENHHISTYNMDYDHYIVQKEANYNTLLKEAKVQNKEIERLKRFIEYYKPKPRFTSRAKDKEKKLAKIEEHHIDLGPKENKDIHFSIEGSNLKNKQLLEFDHLVIGYDEPLAPEFSFKIYGKDKLAICGDNGIGKTTLLKTIINEIPPLEGKIKELRKLTFGYIKQNDYSFNQNETAIGYLRNRYPLKIDRDLRTVLGRFQFKGEDVFKDTLSMSNGEKMRLILCAFSLTGYDILLLDEPTNHLDMITKESLINALKNYEGCIIFISHDRYFINELATSILYLSRDKTIYLEGNYNDLRRTLDRYNSDIKLKKIEDIEKLTIKEKPQKLSNNKINEYTEELKVIEKRMDEIDLELEGDFESYQIIDTLNEEKSELEHRYLEILDILEKDGNIVKL